MLAPVRGQRAAHRVAVSMVCSGSVRRAGGVAPGAGAPALASAAASAPLGAAAFDLDSIPQAAPGVDAFLRTGPACLAAGMTGARTRARAERDSAAAHEGSLSRSLKSSCALDRITQHCTHTRDPSLSHVHGAAACFHTAFGHKRLRAAPSRDMKCNPALCLHRVGPYGCSCAPLQGPAGLARAGWSTVRSRALAARSAKRCVLRQVLCAPGAPPELCVKYFAQGQATPQRKLNPTHPSRGAKLDSIGKACTVDRYGRSLRNIR